MMSQISGPCCDSDIEPDQILYGKVVFTCKFTSSLKIFKIVERNKIQLGNDYISRK